MIKTLARDTDRMTLNFGHGTVFFQARLQQQGRLGDDDRPMARFVAFPMVIDYGDTPSKASDKLQVGLCDYLGAVLETNGIDGFLQHLHSLGFEETDDAGWEAQGAQWRNVPDVIIERNLQGSPQP